MSKPFLVARYASKPTIVAASTPLKASQVG
jgi:hypothetical protein